MGIELIFIIAVSVLVGAVGTGLWMHADIVHYRNLCKQLKAEKKALAEDYHKRLEALGKTLGVPFVMETLDITNLNPVSMPPLEPSEGLYDGKYT